MRKVFSRKTVFLLSLALALTPALLGCEGEALVDNRSITVEITGAEAAETGSGMLAGYAALIADEESSEAAASEESSRAESEQPQTSEPAEATEASTDPVPGETGQEGTSSGESEGQPGTEEGSDPETSAPEGTPVLAWRPMPDKPEGKR